MATPLNQGLPIQDVPPKGGFPAIKIARHLPNRGPHGWVMFGGCGLIMFAGLLAFGNTNHKRQQAKLEKRLARIALVPLLQSEIDQEFVYRTHLAYKQKIINSKNKFAEKVDLRGHLGPRLIGHDPKDFKSE